MARDHLPPGQTLQGGYHEAFDLVTVLRSLTPVHRQRSGLAFEPYPRKPADSPLQKIDEPVGHRARRPDAAPSCEEHLRAVRPSDRDVERMKQSPYLAEGPAAESGQRDTR